jgi:ATP-dependent exoDNAse (exonuclease V) beta subunit
MKPKMNNNKLIIAAAGSGKTTHLVNEALKIKNEKVLITTYTQANEVEIRKKIIEINKFIPENVTVQTWF